MSVGNSSPRRWWILYALLAVVSLGVASWSHFRAEKIRSAQTIRPELYFCLPRDLDAAIPERPDQAELVHRRQRVISACPEAQHLLRQGHVVLVGQDALGDWQVFGARSLAEQPDQP